MSKLNSVRLHPAVVSALFVAYVVVTAESANVAATALSVGATVWLWVLLEATLTFVVMIVMASWPYEMARASYSRLGGDFGGRLRIVVLASVVFVVGGVCATLLVFVVRLGGYAVGANTLAETIGGFAFLAAYLLAAWNAAVLLQKAEVNSSSLVTFLMLVYIPVGV